MSASGSSGPLVLKGGKHGRKLDMINPEIRILRLTFHRKACTASKC